MPSTAEPTPGSQRLTNAEFRQLLMTPRSIPVNPTPDSIKEAITPPHIEGLSTPSSRVEDKNEARKKRKSFYAQLKKQEDNKLAELSQKYRDRACERRKGQNPDFEDGEHDTTAQAYRAVAPDNRYDAVRRRQQLMEESKYLGGDMKHTHLVKGLDYALLQKVKSEIEDKESEQERELERLVSEAKKKGKARKNPLMKEDEEIKFRTKIGRSIYETVQLLNTKHIQRSKMFAPRRMTYVYDEEAETDIPTTLIRSTADVPLIEQATLKANDIVINKLTEIFSHIRSGSRRKMKNKRFLEEVEDNHKERKESGKKPAKRPNNADDSIYGDIGDYVPSRSNSRKHGDREELRSSKHTSSYFNKQDHTEYVDNVAPTYKVDKSAKLLAKLQEEPESYVECYPGLEEMNDDSDDEVDYSKMDLGNKKGPVSRWDFETAEEYSDYMNRKEALPKAAFQYGLKLTDGRTSRKHKGKKDQAHLDREWQKIQNIIHKRR